MCVALQRAAARREQGDVMPDVEQASNQTTSEPTYVTRFDGVRVPVTEYRPVWLDNLAADVTIEGSAMDGVAEGVEAVRSLVAYVRTLYDAHSQHFKFAGDYGEHGNLEDYTASVGGKPLGN